MTPPFAIGPLCYMIPILLGLAAAFYVLSGAWRDPPDPPPPPDPNGVPPTWPPHWPT
jgi:hypothetical protein